MDNSALISRKIVHTRKRILLMNLFISLLCLLLMEIGDFDSNGLFFCVYSVWSLAVFGYLVFSELRYPGLNIMAVFFVGAIMALAYPSFKGSLAIIHGDSIYCDESYNVVTNFVFRTSLAMNLYYSMFIILLTEFSKSRLYIIDIQYVARRFNLFWVSIALYLVSVVLRAVPFLELISSTLALFANNIPMLVLLLLAVYCGSNSRHDKYFKLFVLLVFIEVIYNMFFGFYKANVMRPVVLFAVYYYLHCRTSGIRLFSPKLVISSIMVILFLLFIVYPFMEIKRDEAGFTLQENIESYNPVNNLNILKRVVTGDYSSNDDSDTGDALSDRMSALSTNAFFYQDAYYNGYHRNLLVASFQKMIPRFLWKGKTNASPGMMAKNYLLMKSFDSDAGSSAYVGLFASSYFWGGWIAVIIMCLLNAIVIAFLLKTCFNNLDNLFSWLFLFFLVFSMLRCFEEICDGGYDQCMMYLIYSLIILVTSKLFIHNKKRVKHLTVSK